MCEYREPDTDPMVRAEEDGMAVDPERSAGKDPLNKTRPSCAGRAGGVRFPCFDSNAAWPPPQTNTPPIRTSLQVVFAHDSPSGWPSARCGRSLRAGEGASGQRNHKTAGPTPDAQIPSSGRRHGNFLILIRHTHRVGYNVQFFSKGCIIQFSQGPATRSSISEYCS